MKSMLDDLEPLYKDKFPGAEPVTDQTFVLRDEKKSKTYRPLMQRQKATSLEERLSNIASKKRKIGEVNEWFDVLKLTFNLNKIGRTNLGYVFWLNLLN